MYEDIKTIKSGVDSMSKTIIYFSTVGYEEDGTPDIRVLRWKCQNEEEFEYALNCINDDDIISIN